MYGKWKLAFRKSLYSGGKLERGELLLLRASVHIGAWRGKGRFRVAHLLLTLGKTKCDHHCHSRSQCARPLPRCQVGIRIKSKLLMYFTFCLLFKGLLQAAWTSAKAPAWVFPALLGLPGFRRGESRSTSRNIKHCSLQLRASLVRTVCI